MDAKLNYSDIVALFSEACGLSVADADAFSTAFFELIVEGLETDGIVKINGLGTFKLIAVENRESVNVNTGERFEIKGHKKLTFTPADSFKETVNAPFALFAPVEVEGEIEGTEETVAETADVADEDISEATIEEPAAPIVEIEETVADNLPDESSQDIALQDVSVKEASVVENETVAKNEDAVESVASDNTENESKPVTKNRLAIFSFAAIFIVILSLSAYAFLVNEESTAADSIADNVKVETPMAVAIEGDKSSETVVADSIISVTPVEELPFVLLDTLAKRPLAMITVKDTTDYRISGTVVEHIVELEETLIKISLKHYGDKRLWPYIVQYNNLSKPNDLACGMVLKIPRLVPRF
jgi:nucleoid DNA-binding protein/nucleoid-associated protein YgaU